MTDSSKLLDIQELQVQFHVRQGTAKVINDLNLSLNPGETLGIVGESGCGKSITALAVMGLVPTPPGEVAGGRILLNNEDLLNADISRMREIRGNDISMIFQEPMTSLNPVFKIGEQIAETIRIHQGFNRKDALDHAVEMLKAVDIPSPVRRASEFPHQLSGGMRQRVMIAMALACNPKILIADEPTTALDVTVQAQIFDLLKEIQEQRQTAIMFITHDMGSIAQMASRVAVMYAGRKVEDGPVETILSSPQHPYTQGLITCVPHLEKNPSENRRPLTEIPGVVPSLLGRAIGCPFAPRCNYAMDQCKKEMPPTIETGSSHTTACWLSVPARKAQAVSQSQTVRSQIKISAADATGHGSEGSSPLIEVKDLKIHFNRPRKNPFEAQSRVHAVDGVSFGIKQGSTFGIVGESGSGKTTTGLGIMRLNSITSGQIILDGENITHVKGKALRMLRRRMQFIFQDPYSSLNPHMRTGAIVREPMDLLNVGLPVNRNPRVDQLFEQVGLRHEQQAYFPHQFSGGQRQRIGVARALASQPDLVICDEPVSALDVAIQAQILNLLCRLQEEYNLTYLFISHDLGVVQYICDEIAVMYLGQIVEQADRISLFQHPQHPYTQALLSAVPSAKPGLEKIQQRIHLKGDPPSPIDPPPGCRFAKRCQYADSHKACQTETPLLKEVENGHKVACHVVE